MKNKNYIENYCDQIKEMLEEIMEEENGCNEGSLNMHYDKIIELLKCIKAENILNKIKYE